MSLPQHERLQHWLKPTVGVFVITICLPLFTAFGVSGKSSAEKMLTIMAQPLFLSIVAVMSIGFVLLRRNEPSLGWSLVFGAGLLWILGTSVFASFVVRKWESSIESTELSVAEPLDYLVVLGGGTSKTPDGRAQFGSAGDRVGYAARLYLSGKAKHLVTTGDNLILSGTLAGAFQEEDDPSQQTKRIWKELGIPENVIFELSGQNTFSEMVSLKEHEEYWREKRCAILTSAFHLPRAMNLAAKAGVSAIPIAADYRSDSSPVTPEKLIPEAENLFRMHMIFKEWIAMRINR